MAFGTPLALMNGEFSVSKSTNRRQIVGWERGAEMKQIDKRRVTNTVLVLLLAASFLLTSCYYAPIAKGKLEKVDGFPDVSHLSHKPSVYLEISAGNDGLRKAATRVSEQLTLFTSFTFDPAQAEQLDYKIRIEPSKREESPGVWRMLLTWPSSFCFFFGVTPFGAPLPTPYDSTYTLTASISDRSGNILGSYNIEESVMWWCGWSLILFAPLVSTTEERLWENMVTILYKRILDDGLIVYRGDEALEVEVDHDS